MIRARVRRASVEVQFSMTSATDASTVDLVGDFNDWTAGAHPMSPTGQGFRASVELEPGRIYRFRYLVDGDRWENDWQADAYLPNEFGGDDSVVDLTRFQLPSVPADGDRPCAGEELDAWVDEVRALSELCVRELHSDQLWRAVDTIEALTLVLVHVEAHLAEIGDLDVDRVSAELSTALAHLDASGFDSDRWVAAANRLSTVVQELTARLPRPSQASSIGGPTDTSITPSTSGDGEDRAG